MKSLKTRQLEALSFSIGHWKTNATERFVMNIDLSSYSCECCNRFKNHVNEPSCTGCPIFEKTKEKFCRGTPYEEIVDIKYKALVKEGAGGRAHVKVTPELQEAMNEEVRFLEELHKEIEER